MPEVRQRPLPGVGLMLLMVAGFAAMDTGVRGVFGPAVQFPLAGALPYAAFQMLTSRMRALDNPYSTHFWTGLAGMLIVTPLLLWNAPAMLQATQGATGPQWAVLTAVPPLGTGGHLLLILALGMAPTATLLPFV